MIQIELNEYLWLLLRKPHLSEQYSLIDLRQATNIMSQDNWNQFCHIDTVNANCFKLYDIKVWRESMVKLDRDRLNSETSRQLSYRINDRQDKLRRAFCSKLGIDINKSSIIDQLVTELSKQRNETILPVLLAYGILASDMPENITEDEARELAKIQLKT